MDLVKFSGRNDMLNKMLNQQKEMISELDREYTELRKKATFDGWNREQLRLLWLLEDMHYKRVKESLDTMLKERKSTYSSMEVDEEKVVIPEEDKELNEDWKYVGPFKIQTSKVPANYIMFLKHYENVEVNMCIASVEDSTAYECTKEQLFRSLMPTNRVSSLVVNLFTEILNIRQVQMSERSKTPIQRWYIPCFGCPNFRNHRIYRRKSQSRSSVKYFIENEQLGSVKQIFFPMLKNSHWYLIVFNNEEQKVELWDSLTSTLEDFTMEITSVCKFLDDKIRKKVPFEKYTRALLNVPKQRNGYDCGVYVCRSMEFPDKVMEFHTEKWFSQEQRCLLLLNTENIKST